LCGCGTGNGTSFAGSSEFGVKQVRCKVSDVLSGGCEAKVTPREVADAEVAGDHGTNRRESDDKSFHDSIAS